MARYRPLGVTILAFVLLLVSALGLILSWAFITAGLAGSGLALGLGLIMLVLYGSRFLVALGLFSMDMKAWSAAFMIILFGIHSVIH